MCTLYGRGFIYTSIYVCTWGRVAALRTDSALESRKVGIVFFWSLAEAFRPYDCTYSSAWYRYMLILLCIVYVYIHTSKYYSLRRKKVRKNKVGRSHVTIAEIRKHGDIEVANVSLLIFCASVVFFRCVLERRRIEHEFA